MAIQAILSFLKGSLKHALRQKQRYFCSASLSVTQSPGHDSFFAIVSMAMKGQQK